MILVGELTVPPWVEGMAIELPLGYTPRRVSGVKIYEHNAADQQDVGLRDVLRDALLEIAALPDAQREGRVSALDDLLDHWIMGGDYRPSTILVQMALIGPAQLWSNDYVVAHAMYREAMDFIAPPHECFQFRFANRTDRERRIRVHVVHDLVDY